MIFWTGGTVYLGIHDSGNVFGLRLTLAQIDHLHGSITDTTSRFRPRVNPGLVKVNFVPVLKRVDQSPNWSDELKQWFSGKEFLKNWKNFLIELPKTMKKPNDKSQTWTRKHRTREEDQWKAVGASDKLRRSMKIVSTFRSGLSKSKLVRLL